VREAQLARWRIGLGQAFASEQNQTLPCARIKWLDELLDKSLDLGLKVCTLSHVVHRESPASGAFCGLVRADPLATVWTTLKLPGSAGPVFA
jgi:hypothetical protein